MASRHGGRSLKTAQLTCWPTRTPACAPLRWRSCLPSGPTGDRTCNPFGFSIWRIGDLAAGLAGDWSQTSYWKRMRTVRHAHDPVDDALGNAGAYRELLRQHGQKGIPGRP